MSIKVYIKRGVVGYKEKRMVTAIQKVVDAKAEADSSFASTFKPATNPDELKALHSEYCVENVDFEESPKVDDDNLVSSTEDKHKEFSDGIKDTIDAADDEVPKDFVDPFNASNPNIRSYVMADGFEEEGDKNEAQKTEFDEPTSHQQSFEMPSSDDEKSDNNNQNSTSNNNNNTQSSSQSQKPKKQDPINPSFNEMDNGKKKRSTKKFAKLIVGGVCLLAEKGCIWWTTKDITEDKLAEYQLNDTIDMNILLTLENNQQQPVIEWFRARVKDANTIFKISEEDRQDLEDSLFEVMLEKGIAPTPMQELIMNAAKAFILDMGLKAFQLSSQINNVIGQLKELRVHEIAQHQQHQPEVSSNNAAPVNNPSNETNMETFSSNDTALQVTE